MPHKDPEKQKAAQAAWYQNNKAISDERSQRARRRRYDQIRELKESSPCSDCGAYFPYWVMHYDHIGDDKIMDISRMLTRTSWAKIEEEIAKCELVCANCHSTRTHMREIAKRAMA